MSVAEGSSFDGSTLPINPNSGDAEDVDPDVDGELVLRRMSSISRFTLRLYFLCRGPVSTKQLETDN